VVYISKRAAVASIRAMPGAAASGFRVDALVWALTDLLVEPMPYEGLMQFLREQAEREGPPLPPG
jgi:hypothetical protein